MLKVPIKDGVVIPQKTTFEVLDKKYVYVVDENNIVRSRLITVAAEMPHIFVVTGGLAEGDKILLEGLRRVRENQKIDYDLVEPMKALSQLELYAE